MVVPWLIADPRFPDFRKDSNNARHWVNTKFGLRESGHAFPGIIDAANLLGTGEFEMVRLSEPELRSNPVTGADAIVTVLYQHRPSLLRQFLDSAEFSYSHLFDEKTYTEDEGKRKPFFILRKGAKVEAGFRKGYKDGQVSESWESVVRYTIIENKDWRQEYLEYPGQDPQGRSIIRCGRDVERVARLTFETWAGHIMKFAITQRRWFKQTGAKIEIRQGP